MEDRHARIVRNIKGFDELAQLEANAAKRGALSEELKKLIDRRSGELGRELVAQRTGIDLTELSPAEQKVIEAISLYTGIKKRQGSDAGRTFQQIQNKGLLGAAEAAVMRKSPTQGYQTLHDEGREDLSYEQIIIDHPQEFSTRALWFAKRQLGLLTESDRPPARAITPTQRRTEALVQWLKTRSQQDAGLIRAYDHSEAARAVGIDDMARSGRVFGNVQSRLDFSCYVVGLPPLGLTARSPFEKAWQQESRSWAYPVTAMEEAARRRRWSSEDFQAVLQTAEALPGQAYQSWRNEMSVREDRIRAWAFGFECADGANGSPALTVAEASSYWALVCNPRKWAIDQFLPRDITHDTWGVRKSDAVRFAPGQLAVVRVGVDDRSAKDRQGQDKLEAGIYALCRIESEAFPGTGASDEFWSEGEGREPGWPTVKIHYLRTFLTKPLTIARLRSEMPNATSFLLDGLQASSFPITAEDFQGIVELLGDDIDEMALIEPNLDVVADKLAQLEATFIRASPEVKKRLSRKIERGPIGALVKKLNGYKCQLCEVLGADPLGFRKSSGEHYVEAHHVMPVAMRQIGSLSASNVMTVCANHHRQLHFGSVEVKLDAASFLIEIDGRSVSVRRTRLLDFDVLPTADP